MAGPQFYLEPPQEITHDFWEKRPTKAGYHYGWDCAGSPKVRAPEPVSVHFQVLRQHGDFEPDFKWPDRNWWPYSRYYEWWAGGLAIAFGQTFTYVFLHLDPDWIYERWRVLGHHHVEKVRKPGDFRSYATLEINWQPIKIPEGEYICQAGTSGFDDGPHLHAQVMKTGRVTHEYVDPATVWPGIYETWCLNKHQKEG